MTKTQGQLITEHEKNISTLRAGLVSTKAQLKKMKSHHSKEDMQLALEAARTQRDQAIVSAG
jgi:hypothetical protein